jgi:LssY C-terminus
VAELQSDEPSRRRSRFRRAAKIALVILIAYGLLAYLILPALWTHREHQKGLANLPMVTRTAQGIPGDPINVGLVGDQKDLVCSMHAAGWFPADPITLKSSIEIVGSVLLDRPYKDAPVSNLYYLGRREDLAFEKPVGASADRRNHVRFWKVLDQGEEKRPVWLGAATLDRSVGISHYTGAITHHISPDLDAERSVLAADLENSAMVEAKYQVTGIGPTMAGRNGGGDLYYTDGEIWMLRLVEACKRRDGPAVTIPSPAVTEIKDQIWHAVANAIPKLP